MTAPQLIFELTHERIVEERQGAANPLQQYY
jgi:hypothetical protein